MDKKYKKIVLGIDESYLRSGISIAIDGKLVVVRSEAFKGCECNSSKRHKMRKLVSNIIQSNRHKCEEFIIIVERIRTISQGSGRKQGFGLKPDYLKSTGALISSIVDEAYLHSVPVYSVDTRSWKSQVLGSSTTDLVKYKNYEKPEKGRAIEFIEKKGFGLKIKDKNGEHKIHERGKNIGKYYHDDDAADSGCMALYGFIPIKMQKLKLED